MNCQVGDYHHSVVRNTRLAKRIAAMNMRGGVSGVSFFEMNNFGQPLFRFVFIAVSYLHCFWELRQHYTHYIDTSHFGSRDLAGLGWAGLLNGVGGGKANG